MQYAKQLNSELLRGDLELVEWIPLWAIRDEVEFTLEQHQAFQRLVAAAPALLAVFDAASDFVTHEEGHQAFLGDRWYALSDAVALAASPQAGEPECEHRDVHFDRSICACGSMHHYCNDCGRALDCPYDEEPLS